MTICADCALLDQSHPNHSFQWLESVYDQHLKKIRDEQDNLFSKLKDLEQQNEECEWVIHKVNQGRDHSVSEVDKYFENLKQWMEP